MLRTILMVDPDGNLVEEPLRSLPATGYAIRHAATRRIRHLPEDARRA